MPDDGGISRLQRRLAEIPANVRASVQPALLKQAQAMERTMDTLVPVKSGALKDSIEITIGGQSTPAYSQPGGSMTVPENAVAITVGNHAVRYAHLVEYGTKKTHAHPYFWPAVRLNQKKAKTAIKRAVGRAVKKNWGAP
jgi:HK97 gp10 family phage protein